MAGWEYALGKSDDSNVNPVSISINKPLDYTLRPQNAISTLERLRQHSIVVADTGDFESMRAYHPTDATTNPSLILKAVQQDVYRPLLDKVVRDFASGSAAERADRLLVAFGCEILSIVPGRVSTEIDARLSFDTQATIARARQIMAFYRETGIPRERVLIKIAATWEGIQAARVLEAEGIRCNLTLLFCLPQAVACARAKVTLISPFVGRIYDWHKHAAGTAWNAQHHAGAADPGVQSVTRIFHAYKAHGIATQIMGASFRHVEQITALAGCDLLTISPALLAQLAQGRRDVPLALDAAHAQQHAAPLASMDEAAFRFALNQDAMATEKLAEGIRLFVADSVKLDDLIAQGRQGV